MLLVGNIKIFPIIELKDAGKVIQEIISKATPQAIKGIDWLSPNFADVDGKLKAVTQSFVIKTDTSIILVDSCVGNGKVWKDLPDWSNLDVDYIGNLEKAGFKTDEIDFVVCTHLHFDHVGWNTRKVNNSWEPTFPNAKYVFCKKEYDYWASNPKSELEDDLRGFRESVEPLGNRMKLVGSDYAVTDEVHLVPTFGHTPGHVSVFIESDNEAALITGDTFHHPCQIKNPEWVSFDSDEKVALETRIKLLEKYANSGTLVIGSHFSPSSAGYISKTEDGYIFKAA